MPEHEKIDYIELPASDFVATRAFFGAVFGWHLEAWGDDYLAFADQGVDGGFYRSNDTIDAAKGSALIIFYSADLESTERKIVRAEGTIKQPTYHFPGGRRLHFTDPNGNEYAVWSDRESDGSKIG